MDDIKVQNNSFRDHLDAIKRVLKAVMNSGMTLSLKKTELFKSKLKFVGHWMGDDGISKVVNHFSRSSRRNISKMENCVYHQKRVFNR